MLVLVAGLLLGCTTEPTAEPVRSVAETPGAARVALREIDGDIFKLSVKNLSPAPLVIDRDAIVMETQGGTFPRSPGGTATTYVVPPGGSHAVNVRFDMTRVQSGEPFMLRFDGALYVGSMQVHVPALQFTRAQP